MKLHTVSSSSSSGDYVSVTLKLRQILALFSFLLWYCEKLCVHLLRKSQDFPAFFWICQCLSSRGSPFTKQFLHRNYPQPWHNNNQLQVMELREKEENRKKDNNFLKRFISLYEKKCALEKNFYGLAMRGEIMLTYTS